MSELVAALKASEADIADRLGCVPGGALDQRARRARADDEAASYVLVAAGEFGRILHASLHPDRDDAEDARTTVERRHLRHGPVTTKIVRRVPGRRFGGDIDDDAHDHNASPAISTPELSAVPDAIVELDEETPAAVPTPAANPAPRPLPRIRRYHHSPAPPPLPRSVIDAAET
ncbi:hypothetical protein [Nocardia cyriacigeorgica]|uniref:hypothetical protein n=1 Tax=Nocardia cyriacigeorgica TaxID=135487 RepID=UPI0024544E92|nr:hypothetical protein [Nocardia cyriacigeorgica]